MADGGEMQRLPRDILMAVKVDNSNLDELYAGKKEGDGDGALPREIDSVRDLFHFAMSPPTGKYGYLDGEAEIVDGFAKSSSGYRFSKLFVAGFEEAHLADSRDTHIRIHLRERE
jgi:hypothetical protein